MGISSAGSMGVENIASSGGGGGGPTSAAPPSGNNSKYGGFGSEDINRMGYNNAE